MPNTIRSDLSRMIGGLGNRKMSMLMGEHNHKMDAKGRVSIPAAFRVDLGENFVVTRGFDGCLTAYPMARWNRIEENLKKISLTNPNGRMLSRRFLGNAINCELDGMGRTLISQPLRESAGLKTNVVLVGLGDRVEIWDKERWDDVNGVNGKDVLDDLDEEALKTLEGLEL